MNLKVDYKVFLKHQTKRHALIRFSLVVLLFVAYFVFIAQKYGVSQGFFVTALTWSFFVLCTPVADAGFLIDFPFRLLTGLRMIISEVCVWLIAILLNIYAFFVNPEIYSKTKILLLFKHILDEPFPFWTIIFISLIGTFISIKFGDELIDKVKNSQLKYHYENKHHYRLIIMVFFFVLAFVFYDFLLKSLGVDLPL